MGLWHDLMEATLLLGLLVLGNLVGMPLGGFAYMIFGLAFAVPYFGRVFSFVFSRIIKLVVLVKVLAWSISASGIVLGYLFFSSFFGAPDTILEWWIVVGVSLHAVCHVSNSIIMFEVYDLLGGFRFFREYAPRSLRLRVPRLDEDGVSALVRRNFADMNFAPLLRLLVSLGILFLGLSRLGLLPNKAKATPSLLNCMSVSLSLVGLGPSDAIEFIGPTWLAIRLFVGIVLLVWAVAFIGIALDSIPNHRDAQVALGLGGQRSSESKESVEEIVWQNETSPAVQDANEKQASSANVDARQSTPKRKRRSRAGKRARPSP